MRWDGTLTGRLLLCAVVLMAGCSDADVGGNQHAGLTGEWRTAGCAMPRRPQTTPLGDTMMPVTPPDLDAAMRRIDEGARAEFSGSYAGLEVDQHLVRAIVYRVPDAAFDEFVRQNAEDACIVVRDAAHDLDELRSWHDRIVTDLGFWAAQGVPISSVGSRHDGAGVEVGTHDAARARAAMTDHYGDQAPLIFIEQGPVTPLPSGPSTAP
ncbi:hypothetical protein [Mangrovihabitans endophyticus]|uniref:Lipoprotein n=1 Tax=Mangrovihabitans endophyticus TaxID=1751298 RepID=A0A8J3BYT0_9ACTN|nr:hypothetical protein [Mangrovihabitans endophyticus]GGK83561.1 hypothetical protein GCM10012284_17100 [Mangrovihabitans endophyticus]